MNNRGSRTSNNNNSTINTNDYNHTNHTNTIGGGGVISSVLVGTSSSESTIMSTATITNSSNNHNNRKKMVGTKKRWNTTSKATTTTTTTSCSKFCCRIGTCFILIIWIWFLYRLLVVQRTSSSSSSAVQYDNKKKNSPEWKNETMTIIRKNEENDYEENNNYFCSFRRYPPHRFYGIHNRNLNFLVGNDIEYIYGQWPKVLHPKGGMIHKLCINQTSWISNHNIYNNNNKNWIKRGKIANNNNNNNNNNNDVLIWPFADGTNPSVILMDRLRTNIHPKNDDVERTLSSSTLLADQIQQYFPMTQYIVTVCMTNSQCTWKDSNYNNNNNNMNSMYDLPDVTQTNPDTIRTVLLLLDHEFQKITETTIYLIKNAPFGKNNKNKKNNNKNNNNNNNNSANLNTTKGGEVIIEPTLLAFDDARLFVHNHQLYVSYREGPTFGYDAQVLNPIHIDFVGTNKKKNKSNTVSMTATVYAHETTTFCCGRNMALMEDLLEPQQTLRALTWVDPITVIMVNTTPTVHPNDILMIPNTTITKTITKTTDSSVVDGDSSVVGRIQKKIRQLLPNPKPKVLLHTTLKEERQQQQIAALRKHNQQRQQQQQQQKNMNNQKRRKLVQQQQQPQQPNLQNKNNHNKFKNETFHQTKMSFKTTILKSLSQRQQLVRNQMLNTTSIIDINISLSNSFLLQQAKQPQRRRNHYRRQLLGPPDQSQRNNKEHKSHIHGTNGFMVLLPDTHEFLGVAHLHRPNDRKPNPFARFGHHYTHAFYTVDSFSGIHGHLTGLSSEFILPTAYDSTDGHIIQFVSGLEYNTRTNEIIIAYGINDCEGAITTIDYQTVRRMLKPVLPGQQVIDFMKPFQP